MYLRIIFKQNIGLCVWGILKTEDTTGRPEETQGYAGGILKIEDTKGMFVYDLVAEFSATKPCGIVRNKQNT